MSTRVRTILGSLAMLVFLAAYVWLATLIGGRLPANPWVWLIYYPIVGTAWGLPLIPLLSWIGKGPK
jgi:hypothetical protein